MSVVLAVAADEGSSVWNVEEEWESAPAPRPADGRDRPVDEVRTVGQVATQDRETDGVLDAATLGDVTAVSGWTEGGSGCSGQDDDAGHPGGQPRPRSAAPLLLLLLRCFKSENHTSILLSNPSCYPMRSV